MALAQNPSIAALSNLVLYYDAANVKSYPGAGTTINDMSGNGNNGTLTNGPIWGAANNGVISFDGSDDYISIGSQSIVGSGTSAFSAEICFYNTKSWSAGQYTMFFRIKQDTEFFLVLYNYLGTLYAIPAFRNYQQWGYPLTTTISDYVNKWFTMTIVYNGGSKGNASSFNLYINGSLLPAGTYDFGTAGGVSSNCNIIGADGNSGCNVTTAYHQGFISNYKIYNTALTAAQVQQNYNASRGRFVGTLPFAPTDISGLSLWFDADDPRTLFSDTSGTNRASADGNAVALWVDKSGNGRNASQSTSGYQPLLKTSVLNNRNVVRFDGSNDYLSSVDLDLDYITMFVVTKLNTQTDSGNTAAVCGKSNQDPGRAPPYNLFIYGNVGDATYNYKSSFVSSTEAYPASYPYTNSQSTQNDSVFKLHTGRYDGTTRSYFINGGFQSSTTAQSGVLYKDNELFYIGIDVYSFLNRCFNGDIAEIIVYNSALSATNKLKAEQYLQNKWGIELAFQPTQITGLAVWLDSSDSGTLFQDSSGTTPAQYNNEYIGMWKDKSGNNRHSTQVSSLTSRPILKTNIQNGKPAVYFDGSGTWLSNTVYSYSGTTTLFVVASNNYDNGYYFDGAGGSIQMGLARYSSTTLKLWNGAELLTSPIFNLGNISILESVWNTTSSYMAVNGQAGATGTTLAVSLTGYTVGRTRNGSGAGISQGNFCEIILYQGVLTLAQRQQVEAYLNQKWGVF